jgi:hypothetical protein
MRLRPKVLLSDVGHFNFDKNNVLQARWLEASCPAASVVVAQSSK